MGSPGYMSPEQAIGAAVDTPSDVFALGVVFFEMASGRLPFPGDSLRALLHDPPTALVAIRPEIPAAFGRVVARCLEKDPARRYNSAIELQRDLDEVSGSEAAAGRSSRARFGTSALVAAAVTIVLVTAGAASWMFARRAASERAHQAAVEEVEQLVNAGRFVDVWRVASDGLRRWPDDARLQRAMQTSTDVVTIATDPPGAEVRFKAYADIDGEWLPLGTSPLQAVRAPLGMLRWQLVKAGFEPFEARLEVGAPAAAAGRPDTDARPIRLRKAGEGVRGAVFVPGGRYMETTLGDYWIDRTEVRNRDFQEFIVRGGYENPAFWTELERSSPSLFSRLGRAAEFSDRTGRPGPSTWELGAYPEGRGDYPVSGVSWFEAVAYCASMHKVVPSRVSLAQGIWRDVLHGSRDARQLRRSGSRGGHEAQGPWAAWHVRNGGQCQRVGVERVPGPDGTSLAADGTNLSTRRRRTMHGRRSIAPRQTASDVRRKPNRSTRLHSPRGGRRFLSATRAG